MEAEARVKSFGTAKAEIMKPSRPAFLAIAIVCAATTLFSLNSFAQSTPPRITQRVDDSKLVALKGSTLAVVRVASDHGKVADSLALERLQLVLQRSPEQESALRMLLDQQQDKSSPNYHKWLTPEQFGQKFGPAESDVQAVANWLEAKGFRITNITKGRTAIEFSGDADLVRKAFHSEIHNYFVNGQAHIANAGDLQIPAALSRVVAGIASLHNFFPKPQYLRKETSASIVHKDGAPVRSITLSDGSHALGPDDYATIYNIQPLYAANVTGAGRTIAVLGVTDIVDSDISDFDAVFGLPGGNYTVVHNGADPGIVDSGDQFESTLDNEWAGATGRGAQIKFVVSGSTTTEFGTDLSAQYVIENNLADVMTVSYGACEVQYSAAGAQFEQDIAEQAAAQGITYMASTGDAGAEGCDSPNFETVANGPITVNLPAATPFTVAVGGTEFNEGTGTFWNSTNNRAAGSALSYITEDTWNESCAEGAPNCTAPSISAGSGGVSQLYGLPTWQQGIGVPLGPANQPGRGVPDVSLSAAGHDAYFICFEGSCQSTQDPGVVLVFGTSASAPSFAGIMSLVDQGTNSRQGLADYVLYKLAAGETLSSCNASSQSGLPASSCIFNDVTVGNNSVPGETGYGNANSDYQAAVGWDAASGLGSVNVNNLVTQWNSVSFNSTTTKLQISAMSAAPNQSISAQISVSSGSGTPTGDVSVVATGDDGSALGLGFAPLSGGSATIAFSFASTQNYNLSAHYAGNGSFGASDSAPDTVAVESFTASANPTQQAVAAGGMASSTVTVTGANFTGAITLTCVVSGTKPTDTEIPTCSFNSSGASPTINLTVPGTETGTATLNVSTTAKSALHRAPWNLPPARPGWIAAAVASLIALLFFIGAPGRKRRWRAAFAAMTFAAMSGLAGCGSSGGNPGTTPDVYTVAVSASGGGTTQPISFTLTVQ
jgi:subtilase family serine protease